MANPQLENGFTRISNELLEAIVLKVYKLEYLKIILFLIRITYGFNRKRVKSHYKSFSISTGIPKDHMEILISEMYLRKIIYLEQISKDYFWAGLNKNYEEWNLGEMYI